MNLKEKILSKISEKEIMQYYFNQSIIENRPIYKNPTRPDSKGTCWFSWTKNNRYFLFDKSGTDTSVDCFKLAMHTYQCGFREGLFHIIKDLNLSLSDIETIKYSPKIKKLKKLRKKENEKKDIIKFNKFKIFTRSFNSEDLSWWKQFGITLKTLKFYNVHAVSKYQQQYNFNKFRTVYKYDAKDPCYAFKVNNNFKLYRPLTEHYFNKWKSNVKKDDIFGLKNIPYYGKNLFITSGLKDLMCVSEMGYESIAPQSETTPISEDLILDLKSRFTNIIVLFDNDRTGIEQMNRYKEKYNIKFVYYLN